MIDNPNLIMVTFGPPLLFLIFVIFNDKFKEPLKLVTITFILGLVITIPAAIFNQSLIWFNTDYNLSFLAGFTEEPLKFLVLYLFIRRHREFNEKYDGIVYGTYVSLGFASLENYEYVMYNTIYDPMAIAYIRAISDNCINPPVE